MFRGDAERWWETIRQRFGDREPTWVEFQQVFNDTYCPAWVKEQKVNEFIELVQGTKKVAQYEAEFIALTSYALELMTIEAKKAAKFQRELHAIFAMLFEELRVRIRPRQSSKHMLSSEIIMRGRWHKQLRREQIHLKVHPIIRRGSRQLDQEIIQRIIHSVVSVRGSIEDPVQLGKMYVGLCKGCRVANLLMGLANSSIWACTWLQFSTLMWALNLDFLDLSLQVLLHAAFQLNMYYIILYIYLYSMARINTCIEYKYILYIYIYIYYRFFSI